MKEQSGKSRCGGCGRTFSSLSAFDSHRVGVGPARRCLSDAQIETWACSCVLVGSGDTRRAATVPPICTIRRESTCRTLGGKLMRVGYGRV